MMTSELENRVILSFDEVRELFGVSRTSVDRWEKAGTFPKRIYLGIKKIGWRKEDIQQWINEKIASNQKNS
jgi:prophage regulatory protein